MGAWRLLGGHIKSPERWKGLLFPDRTLTWVSEVAEPSSHKFFTCNSLSVKFPLINTIYNIYKVLLSTFPIAHASPTLYRLWRRPFPTRPSLGWHAPHWDASPLMALATTHIAPHWTGPHQLPLPVRLDFWHHCCGVHTGYRASISFQHFNYVSSRRHTPRSPVKQQTHFK